MKKNLGKIFKFLCGNCASSIVTLILAISTFYSARVALKIAFNNGQQFLINNGFHYGYNSEKGMNYKYYSISLTNASPDKPINLTGGFSISISTNKEFKNVSKNKTYSKINISKLLDTDLFPINLEYAEMVSFIINEDFAKYVKSKYPNRIKVCNKRKKKCEYKKFYIRFCLYDTLDNKYCYIFTEDDINEISNFIDGKMY